jgi:NADPH:quinone reductase-like Zn-dependent oxidoreductase
MPYCHKKHSTLSSPLVPRQPIDRSWALIFAKAAGATTIVTSASAEKLEYVKSNFGADYTINYKTHPNWGAEVQRITKGQGANHIIEIGGVGTIQQSLDSVARGGVISIIGFLSFTSQDKHT